jgi:ribonucleoside-triphosphate reductase
LEGIFLFVTPTCPNCKTAKRMLDEAGIVYQVIDAYEKPEMAENFHVQTAPSLVIKDKEHSTGQTFANVHEIRNFCQKQNS